MKCTKIYNAPAQLLFWFCSLNFLFGGVLVVVSVVFCVRSLIIEDVRRPLENKFIFYHILVPRGRAPFGQHQESRPLAKSNNGSPRFTDFPSLCACSESILTNLIGSGLNLLCLQSHSNTECCWTWPEVAILGADQKECGLWGREWFYQGNSQLPRSAKNLRSG